MRSQGTKPLPKKGALTKTTFKPNSPTKPVKKKVVTTKKVKKLVKKSLVKTSKRTAVKDDSSDTKTEDDSSTGEKSDSDSAKSGTSNAPSLPRSESPAKRTKKELKEKKKAPRQVTESVKLSAKKIVNKKGKLTSKGIKKKEDESDKIRYKLNSEIRKKAPPKMSKLKTIPKKEAIAQQKKKPKVLNKNNVSEMDSKEDKNTDKSDSKSDQEVSKSIPVDKKEQLPGTSENKSAKIDSEIDTKSDNLDQNLITSTQSNSKTSSAETSKSESDRPPKFFTSARSPRTVDIDVRCCKTSKGNLSVYERFISSKIVDTKNHEVSKEKSSLNNPVSQDPEIDVYAFTDKADSPKSILSDFRNPMDKNTEQKVRPVARVKGTVIDKKIEIEKKKFSPHRPIEEVVKQLKAKKGSEVLKVCQTQTSPDVTSSVDSSIGSDEKDKVEDPKPIVSKSYKMVARKSSIPGKPFSPIKFLDQDENSQGRPGSQSKSPLTGKKSPKSKSKSPKSTLSDDELENSKFSLNTKSQSRHYSSSDESVNDSNDDNDTKESSESESNTNKKTKKTKKYRRITDAGKKNTSRELKELSKDSIIDLKDDTILGNEKPSKRRLKLLSMWSGPKKHRMASLNAIAKVHCLYENESRTHMELGLMKTVDRLVMPTTSKPSNSKKKEPKPKDSSDEKQDTTSESEYERKEKKDESSEDDTPEPSTRTLRGEPGIRSAGKYWDPKSCTSSSEDSEHDSKFKVKEKKKITPKPSTSKPEPDKPPAKMKKTAGVPVKKRRIRNEVVMDLKDMVVQKRMASLNATAILAASYEKRSPKSSKDGTTSDSCSDESFSRRPKNGAGSGVKSEAKTDGDKADAKKDTEEVAGDRKQKVEVIVNQDTDVTITGVYSTHHEGFCTVSGLQYRISATSHTQTTATANCEKEGCGREEGARYTPLSALSSMQPPADHAHAHPVPELGGLARRAGCSSAFSAPSPSAHHEPGYYQPAGPLIKEAGADAERALARYHPPHYHPPHPPVLPQYGPYYPSELCYGRYYRPPAPAYHVPAPQPDAPMVGVAGDPYPPPQYYGAPPCYQHPPPRVGYLEYRGCPCPMNACPKNVHIGPATGKAPASGGPADAPAPAPPGAPLRPRGRARAASPAVAHGSGKDPPLEPEPPAAADAPRPCPLPAIGGASPKRELYAGRARRAGGAGEGPPSPARGSAGACAPQPPPAPPRRARLGKAMARRSLAGDDTTVLSPPPPDDDVLAVSPPAAAPVDLSSSDETPLLDVKKENEPPAPSPPRPAAPAPPRPAKRRHSRPKLEIELGDLPLDDACRTNGIGEHVKLQKRRKVSSEQSDAANRTETITSKDIKKKSSPKPKRSPKSPPAEKKTLKRKGDSETENSVAKKINVGKPEVEDVRLTNVAALPQEQSATKPKNKSALLLDNLIRKNSIDRADPIDVEINPAELFLSPRGNSPLNCTKKTLNINNNVVENSAPVNGVQPKTIAAVSQLIERKLAASKNALKTPVVDTNVTQSLKPLKSVLKPQNAEVVNQMLGTEESGKPNNDVSQCEPIIEKDNSEKTNDIIIPKDTSESANVPSAAVVDNVTTTPIKTAEKPKLPECNAVQSKDLSPVSNGPAQPTEPIHSEPAPKPQDPVTPPKPNDANKPEKVTAKRSKLSIEKEPKKGDKAAHEKVVKLMVFKKSVIKADEAASVVEEACASPLTVRPSVVRRRRRRSGLKRHRRPPALLPPPLADREPRWSNGWHWDGECTVSKVYLNNDMRQDRTARCYSRMLHDNGDLISRGDCVLLRAAPAKAQPFVAKVARLWENPDDGEMMVSLVWYYRPEHTELGRTADDAPDEVFASRHRDANSVACIEDKCYVLTFNEYCRYRKRLKAAEEGIPVAPSIVPPMPAGEVFPAVDTTDSKLTPAVSPDLVLFCRKIYDFRSKKIQMPNK